VVPQPHPGLTLRDFVRAMFRQRRKIIAFSFLVAALTVAWIVFAPRAYESEAKLYVRIGRENTLDPTASTGQAMPVYHTRESEMNSILHVMGSDQVARTVVEEVGVDTILNDLNPDDEDSTPSSNGFNPVAWAIGTVASLGSRLDPVSSETRALRKVKEKFEIEAPPNSNFVTISYRAGNPQLAQKVTATWVDVFQAEHLRITGVDGSLVFFTSQTEDIKKSLAAAETELRDLKSGSNLASVEGQTNRLESHYASICSRLSNNQSSLTATEARIEKLRRQLSELPPEIQQTESSGMASAAWDLMREKLYELQIQESDMRVTLTEDHPELKAIAAQAEELQAVLDAQPATRKESVKGMNPTYQKIDEQLQLEQANLAGILADREDLLAQQDNAEESLRDLNQTIIDVRDLERQVALLDSDYREQVRNAQQARTNTSLDEAKISSVNVVQDARIEERPVNPNKSLAVIAGMILILFGGPLLALTAEYFDPSFTTSTQVESSLGLPVLVTIPRTAREESLN